MKGARATRPIVVIMIVAALSSPVDVPTADAQTPAPTPLTAFADVLMLTRRAVTSHWLVGKSEWTASAAAWTSAAAGLAPESRGLTRCWPPGAEARGVIEEAQRLFERSRGQGPDAYALYEEHKRLLAEADRRLGVGEVCYRDFRAGASPR